MPGPQPILGNTEYLGVTPIMDIAFIGSVSYALTPDSICVLKMASTPMRSISISLEACKQTPSKVVAIAEFGQALALVAEGGEMHTWDPARGVTATAKTSWQFIDATED